MNRRRNRLVWPTLALVGLASIAPPALLGQQEEPSSDELTIPEGTEFKLHLHTTVSSKTSKSGDRVLASLIDPVAVEDREVLPKGVRLDGHIGEIRPAGRKGKGGFLYVVFDTVELPNGEKVALIGSLTEIFSSEGGTDPTVGVEGDLKGRGASRKKQLTIVVAATAAGLAGGTGPAIGAGIGGLMAALLFPKGKEAVLSAGSLIGMRLDRDVIITMPPGGVWGETPNP